MKPSAETGSARVYQGNEFLGRFPVFLTPDGSYALVSLPAAATGEVQIVLRVAGGPA